MKPVVFIHTNDKQLLGAKVAAYLLKARSRSADHFLVETLRLEDTPHLYRREGQTYLRKGRLATWRNDDLQSFSPLRMKVPQAMSFRGRALVIDPDVFAVGDVYELLARPMEGRAILARKVAGGYRDNGQLFYASSVMLLDCARLTHWQWDRQIDDMFAKTLDYGPWISLRLEDPATIGPLEEDWNHFDTLAEHTKLLHNTERSTQPWKTGLPVDYDTTSHGPRPGRFGRLRSRLRGMLATPLSASESGSPPRYLSHPDHAQERYFLKAVRECLSAGVFDERFLREEMQNNHVRHDLLERIGELDADESARHGGCHAQGV
jgi:hypothetical protein